MKLLLLHPPSKLLVVICGVGHVKIKLEKKEVKRKEFSSLDGREGEDTVSFSSHNLANKQATVGEVSSLN